MEHRAYPTSSALLTRAGSAGPRVCGRGQVHSRAPGHKEDDLRLELFVAKQRRRFDHQLLMQTEPKPWRRFSARSGALGEDAKPYGEAIDRADRGWEFEDGRTHHASRMRSGCG